MALPFAPVAAVDFHLHTIASDGAHPAGEIAASVQRARLSRWALTDHDTTAGWQHVAGTPGLICGVEATAGADGREIHIVGLGIDPLNAPLQALLAEIRTLRIARVDCLLARLPDDVRRGLTAAEIKPPEADSVGRLHLAQAITKRGGVATVRDAFQFHLADEHVSDTGLPQFPPVAQIASAIRAAGGVAILAHPGVYRAISIIGPLTDSLDGIEAAHPGLPDDLQRDVLELAELRGLLVSIGSDTHRISSVRRPGAAHLAHSLLVPLLARLG